MENKDLKVYYTIKEVAAIFNVNESLLRYWEQEFPNLKPKTARNKVRQYTKKDIEQIRVIYNLIKVRGFKISAAKKVVRADKEGVEKNEVLLSTLISVRDELQTIKKEFDSLV